MTLATVPASAQSTKGGNGGQGNVAGSPLGGTSSLTGPGGVGGVTGESYEGAGGGGAGATGGDGGVSSLGSAGGLGGTTPGASGGDGIGGGSGSRASGGGGGAHGAVYTSSGSSAAPTAGGAGGAGGDSSDGDGGGGGASGYGIVIDTSGPFVVNHLITGGNGGRGGNGWFYGGGGGDGGHGIAFTGAATATINSAIAGGNGGAGGTFISTCCAAGGNGAGGIGLVGSDINLSLNAAVSGGLAGDGVTRAAALQLGGSSSLTLGTGWSLTGGIVVESGGNVDFFQSTNLTLADPISGAGSISKSGAGTLTLSGNNTYTGGTTLLGGVVEVSSDNNLGASSGGLTFNGGTLATTASFNSGRAVTLSGNGELDVAGSTELGLTGVVTGTGSLTKSGAGTLTLSGNNTYTGGTVLLGGVVEVSSDSNLGTGGLTFNGGRLDTTASFNSSRAVTLSGNGELDVTASTELGLTGVVTGTGSLTKSGAGTLTLSGNNTYTGGTVLLGGVVAVSSDSNLGTGGLTFNGGRLDTTASFNSSRTVTLSGNGELDVTASTNLGLTGVVSGTGSLTKSGAGTLTLSGNNTYTGGTVLLGGVVEVSSDSNLGASSGGLTFNGGTLATRASFNSGRAVTLSGNAELDVAGSTNLGLTGVLSGSGSLTKSGAGTLTLSGTNTYTGGTVLLGGVIVVSSDSSLGTGGLTFSGGTLVTTAGFSSGRAVTLGANEQFDVAGSTNLGLTGVLSGTGSLTKSGTGTLTLSGNNTYTGGTVLLGGVVEVSSDGNLGTGGLTFSGGTLATTASFSSGRAVTLSTNGVLDVAASTELGLTGSVTGPGNLVKRGAGTLSLDNGTNAYGNTLVEAGTLIGNATSISGSIGNAATVVFDQAIDVSFAGDIVSLSAVSGAMVKRGAGNLALTGHSFLDWSIESGALTTAAGRFEGNSFIDANGTLIFDQGSSAVYGGVFTGSGDIAKSGAGTLFYNGDSRAFSGTTTVATGMLIVGTDVAHGGAVLGGTFDVGNGAILGGHGTLGSGIGSTVTIGTGGTAAPGNSIGTLTVNGNYVQSAGSVYLAEIAPGGTSDLIDVIGTATLNGGTVFVDKTPGIYAPGTRYTLLTATGGVIGQFATLDQNMPFIDLALAYDPGNVFLDVTRNDVTFPTLGITRNQVETAAALESLGSGNALYDAVASTPDTRTALASFEALSGEVLASAKSALIDDSRFVRDAANNRMRSAYGGETGSNMPTVGYGQNGMTPAAIDSSSPALWGEAFGAWGTYEGDGNAASMDSTTGGFLTGLDGELAQGVRLGLLAGYSHTTFDVAARASSGNSENWHLGVYGGQRWNALRLSGGLAYSWHDISTDRSVAIPGFTDSLSGNYDASTFQAFGEAGYQIQTTGGLSFEPFANLNYVNLNTDGFAEEGGLAALRSGGDDTDAVFTTLGINLASAFDLDGLNAKAHGKLGWRHAFGDMTPLSEQSFSGSDAFTVAGIPIGRDTVAIEAGLNIDLSESATFGIAYQGQFGDGAAQNGLKADLNVRF
ncbi:autotransporter domain-containing protein [Peteryoungia ipomoeae]|nr:autotransporter domain-containing protein [Peteryoungia ipomoeae]